VKNQLSKKINKSSLKPTKKSAPNKSVKTKLKAKSKAEIKLTDKSKEKTKVVSKTKVETKSKKLSFKKLEKLNLNPSKLQKGAMVTIGILTFLTFFISNLQIFFWLKSDWLISTVLPAVVTELTNQERNQFAENPLTRSEVLDQAAKLKAEDMAKNSYFAHYSPDGVSPWHWFQEVGYTYAYAGENLAVHFNDSKMVVDAWMNSPTHKANIINDKYTEIGIGTAKGVYDGYETVFVVQLFGTPAIGATKASLPPVALNTNNNPSSGEVGENSNSEILGVSSSGNEKSVKEGKSKGEKSTTFTEEEFLPIEAKVKSEETNTLLSEVEILTQAESKNEAIEHFSTPEAAKGKNEMKAEESTVIKETENFLAQKNVNENEIIESEGLHLGEKDTVYSDTISVASGLQPATEVELNKTSVTKEKDGSGFLSFLVNPRQILGFIYPVLGILTVLALLFSVVLGFKKRNFAEIGYGVALLLVMGGLFFVQFILTGKVLIV